MTNEFIKWAESVETLIRRRVNKYFVTVDLHIGESIFGTKLKDTITIAVYFINGMCFSCSFSQKEFNRNNYHQRRGLAKRRREDMIWSMENH